MSMKRVLYITIALAVLCAVEAQKPPGGGRIRAQRDIADESGLGG